MKREVTMSREESAIGLPILAAILGCAAIVASFVAENLAIWVVARPPFVWRDVALVYFLSALPAAAIISAALGQSAPVGIRVGFAVLLGAIGAAIFAGGIPVDTGHWLRSAGALCTAGSITIGIAEVLGAMRRTNLARLPNAGAIPTSLAVAVLFILPAVYTEARCRNDRHRLAGFLQQSRLGEAHALAQGLLLIKPDAIWEGEPLQQSALRIERSVLELEGRVAKSLPQLPTDEELLARGRELAVLGRTDAALQALRSSTKLAAAPSARNLLGAIHETRGEWAEALLAYRDAKRGWQGLPASNERSAGLQQATMGIAYAERKRGRYSEAEAAYRELLMMAPTAETHFLLAQFYEDAQQAGKAQAQARKAMALAPDRYSKQGQVLIDKLITRHFGCWSVLAVERTSPSAALSAEPRANGK